MLYNSVPSQKTQQTSVRPKAFRPGAQATSKQYRPARTTQTARRDHLRNPKTTLVVASLTTALFSAVSLSFPFTVLAAQDSTTLVNPAAPSVAPAPATPAVPITLTDGTHAAQTVSVHATTVKDALTEANITLSDDDRVAPALTTPITPSLPVVVTRVRFQLENRTSAIPFRTVFKMSRDVAPGHIQAGHKGAPGVLTTTYRVGYVNDKATSHKLVARKVTQAPQDNETLAGIRTREARALPSRAGTYNRLRSMNMVATGYSPYEGSSQGLTANGMHAGYGLVAVDRRVIRLGTRLYIEGYGYAVAADTGGAIKGRRIDLGHTTYREASNVGRRAVKVWVLAPAR